MPNETPSPSGSFYLPRSGEAIAGYLEALQRPPETPLNDAERQAMVQFEARLLAGEFATFEGGLIEADLPKNEETGQVEAIDHINDHTGYTPDRHEVTVEYLLNPDGVTAAMTCGLEVPADATTEQLAHLVRRFALSKGVDSKQFKKFAQSSEAFAKTKIVEAITKEAELSDPTRVVVFTDGTKLTKRASGFFRFRDFLTNVSHDLKQNPHQSNLIAAQKMMTGLYQKRINDEIETIYPDLLYFWQQASALGKESPQRAVIHEALAHIHKPIERLGTRFTEGAGSSFIIRLDRLRNGASMGTDGFTSVSHELEAVFEARRGAEHDKAVFTPEEVEALSKVEFDAKQMQTWCQDYLAHVGKLSNESDETYIPKRPQRAADGKWQVIIKEGISAMGAEDPEGVLEIPADFKRDLTRSPSPAGVVSGAAHELTHVYQKDNIRNNPNAPLLSAKLGAKRPLAMREAGSIISEVIVQERLFGQERSDNPHYARAMQAIEAGGGEIAAIKAFYNSYLESDPHANKTKAAGMAESRVKRLLRRKGGFDSQALNYAETALLVGATRDLPSELKAVIFAEGAFDLVDMVALHRFGLLPQGQEVFDVEDYINFVTPKLKQLLPTAN